MGESRGHFTRRVRLGTLIAGLGAALALTAVPAAAAPALYRAGFGQRSINPDNSDGTWGPNHETVYLGGFGLGSPNGATIATGDRHATGILGRGADVRAFAVSDGKGHTFALADIQTQGWFVATNNGPYGLVDMRKKIAADTAAAAKKHGKHGRGLPAEDIVIQSDHTHGGPDPLGVWGGIPTGYMAYIKDQVAAAVEDAFNHMQPAKLSYGTAEAGVVGRNQVPEDQPANDPLLTNQFGDDPFNTSMDSELRVLQAKDPTTGANLLTVLNLSSHADVLGSGNRLITGDWPTVTDDTMEQTFGGHAMTVVGTLGRSQPARHGCATPTGDPQHDGLCGLQDYADRVVSRAQKAVASERAIGGTPVVGARSYLIQDPATNAVLLGLMADGKVIGAQVNRSQQAPWLTGNVLGTVTGSARIGDVLLSAGPGEMYPQIPLKVRELATGAHGFMTAGLADDQLGYLIAPLEHYALPLARGATGQNDNYLFNVSHTIGERVTCSLLRGAGEVFGAGSAYRDAYTRCVAFANDAVRDHGADVGPGT